MPTGFLGVSEPCMSDGGKDVDLGGVVFAERFPAAEFFQICGDEWMGLALGTQALRGIENSVSNDIHCTHRSALGLRCVRLRWWLLPGRDGAEEGKGGTESRQPG